MANLRQRVLVLLSVLFCSTVSFAQNSGTEEEQMPRPTNNATSIAIGSSNLYDTYLSPLEYKGTSLRFLNERMKQIGWFNNRFIRQQLFEVEVARAENPAKNAREYWLLFGYNWGGHYKLYKAHNLRLLAGGFVSGSLGVLYNERNSNNPASARAYANFNLSVQAFYKLHFATFRWQVSSPVAGVLFSPHFGQSYYEISLGNTVGVANFASLHNQRALRNYITVDLPTNWATFRLGYLGSYYQTKVNDLQTHTYSHSVVLGVVYESINVGGRKMQNKDLIRSSYYFE
ncbi:DUF3316 domain-containing protein [Dysgonomonas sp. 216]|uniref:DUF3316 domain-containing protein n=1 Tax=Dysgonomonas sp. 216 TaxID=2302934 RepID=UPI0013D4AB36|nr:DUF3316 domain-containing protein [Dysgonomonas sp. 216]NDW17586.1 DUF3316 domain-containing protein [Dysgonomonas sp. 216]